MMKLFPHTLLRTAGSTYDQLENLEIAEKVLDDYFSKKEAFRNLKKKIDSKLYDLIGSLEDRDKQNLLLNLKRDIYNDRNISDGDLEQAYEATGDNIKELIQSYFSLSDEIARAKKNYEDKFIDEVDKSRKFFRELIQGENFKKGLLLSSKSLLKGLERYSEKEPSEFSRSDRKAEQGALKYVTRLRTKTSPFSTFTNLSMLGHENSSDILAVEEKRSINSHVRLNNYLFKYLRDIILSNPEIYTHFLLRPNPTIRQEGEAFVYLTNNNNVESFQRIEVNPLLELLAEKLSEKEEGIRFNKILEMLEEYVDADQEALQNYINELVQYGFLEFNLGVSGIDTEWDVKLRDRLKELEDEDVSLIAELRETLKELRELAQKYEKTNVNERDEILSEAFEKFKSAALKLHEDAGLPEVERMTPKERKEFRKKQREENKEGNSDSEEDASEEDNDKEETPFKHKSNTYFHFKPKNIFYEDSTLDINGAFNKEALSDFVEHINRLLSSLSFTKGKQAEMDKMVHFFKQNYEGSEAMDLFSFYEDYYREVKKPEAERKKQKNKNDGDDKNQEKESKPETIEKIQKRNELLDEWVDAFKEQMEKGEQEKNVQQITVTQQQIDKVNEELDVSTNQNTQNSLGMFVQFFEGNDEELNLKGVVNSMTSGFGKMVSRFLHLFDDEIKNGLQEWNTSLVDDDLLLENTDASYFNANLHPPLMPNEIWIPGGHNALKEEQQIPVTDLEVKLNNQKDELELFFKPENQKAYIFDLGFQGAKGRSQLFQMLSNFTLMDYIFFHPVTSAINKWVSQNGEEQKDEKDKDTPKEISEFPRIEYENNIILQRKRWHVPRSLLPHKSGDESDWDYFLKVNAWRRQHNIPKEVFVYVTSRHQRGKIPPQKRQKLSSDDYKPQYINFNNPLLIELFESLVRKVPISMKIEEMLPASDQLFEMDGERFVTEFIVQWYNFNKN